MKITINYFGQLGQFAGKMSETRQCRDRLGLSELLSDVARDYGGNFRRLVVDDRGHPRPSLLIAVNGEAAPGGSSPALSDGDEVTLLPPIAGG